MDESKFDGESIKKLFAVKAKLKSQLLSEM